MAERGRLSGSALKWIAAAAMTADHIGLVLCGALPAAAYTALRSVGRLAMPVFCFFVAEGARRTGSLRGYALRLLIFALAAEVPFDLISSGRPFDAAGQNVMFTLLAGLVAAAAVERMRRRPAAAVLCAAGLSAAAQLLRTDYGMFGVWLVLLFALWPRDSLPRGAVLAVLFFCMGALAGTWENGLLQLCALFALPLLRLYDGSRGRGWRYGLYAYYPLHMLLLYLLETALR